MITNRQKLILNDFSLDQGKFITAEYLAKKYNVSLRTIKSDIACIKREVADYGAKIISVSSKGNQLLIDNPTDFSTFLQTIGNSSISNSCYEQSSRVSHILRKLINGKSINPFKISNELFISRSTLSNDLKIIKEKLQKYNIKLIVTRNNGIYISGHECDIRQCIIRENLLRIAFNDTVITFNDKYSDIYNTIKNVLLKSFIENKIIVSDFVFQNLVVHLYTSLWRMMNNHYIDLADKKEKYEFIQNNSYLHVRQVADEILKAVCSIYNLSFSQYESYLLAINIQGKRELSENDYISKEIDDFIYHSLVIIKKQYAINFIDDVDLRISLALHTVPLISRMNSNLFLKNSITYEIKQNYILVFDIASTYANELYKKYNIRINDDEISYLALHFANAMQNKEHIADYKILLISPEKKSNTFLVRQKFKQWFNNDIKTFDIIKLNQIATVNLHDYDAVFTTDKDISEKYNLIHIDLFLKEDNYQKIEFALNGFSKSNDIANKFIGDLFFAKKFKDKAGIIEFMTAKVSEYYHLDKSFYDSIIEHEQVNTSYFGNRLAILHPVSPITETTFISTLILKEPVTWDEKTVQLVFLVSVEKQNKKAFSLWYYLSYFISNADIITKILACQKYEDFYDLIMKLYDEILSTNSKRV